MTLQRVIDILKVDIEYTEWDAFEDAIESNALKNVKQIATELHVWTDQVKSYVRFHRILVALENAGFEKWIVSRKGFNKAVNPRTGKMTNYHYQLDMGFINLNFLKQLGYAFADIIRKQFDLLLYWYSFKSVTNYLQVVEKLISKIKLHKQL